MAFGFDDVPGFLFGEGADSQSGPQAVPNLFNAEEGRGFVGQAQNMLASPQLALLQEKLKNLLVNPSFAPQNSFQQNMLQGIRGQSQGQANASGLGNSPLARNRAIASQIPALQSFRQNAIGNLQGAIQSELGRTGAGSNIFTQLASLGAPRYAQQSTGTGATGGVAGPALNVGMMFAGKPPPATNDTYGFYQMG